MRNSYLVFGRPVINDDEIAEVVASMKSGWLGTGPKVASFERQVAEYKGSRYAVALNSCTAALHLSCLTMGLRQGDEVITTAMTFCATVNAIIHAGATPVLADIDPVTFNISTSEIEKKITPRTRAILPVHFAGRSCDMDSILALADRHNLFVIEDCAHAIETEFKGRKAGTFGHCGVLSFYSTKNVVTGEGGMILTDNEEVAVRSKILALHGMSQDAWKRYSDDGFRHYEVVETGFKYNMTDLQAAIGIHQMNKVERHWLRRLEIWNRYNEAFSGLSLGLPAALDPQTRHGLHLYTLRVNEKICGLSRDSLLTRLHKKNIGTGVHYRAIPVHPVYQRLMGWKPEDFPVAYKLGEEILSLPLSAGLADDDVGDVIEAVRESL